MVVRTTLFNTGFYLHLCLQVILPLVGSYGDTSISTMSPGRILIYLILIFPETCANISAPLSSSTLKEAFEIASMLYIDNRE